MSALAARVGYIPLVDSAPLHVAARLGFAARRGLDLVVQREHSWATVRDKLAVGRLDAAHLIATMPLAAALGLMPLNPELKVPLALSLNGHGVTVSNAVWSAMQDAGASADGDPDRNGVALAQVIGMRAARGLEPLSLGVVFHHSPHRYDLCDWLARHGVDPLRDIRLPALPPPFMADALEAQVVDGFCVGEPWNSAAVLRGCGRLVTTKARMGSGRLDKVLACRSGWAVDNPEAAAALAAAVCDAQAWCADPGNRPALVDLLASEDGLNCPAAYIEPVLEGRMRADPESRLDVPDAIIFPGEAEARAVRAEASWYLDRMVRFGDAPAGREAEALAPFGGP